MGSKKDDIIRQRIRERLWHLGLTMSEASERAGKTRGYLRVFLGGKGGMTTTTLEAIAKVLRCSPAYLRGETDDPSETLSGASPVGLRKVQIVGEAETGAFRPRDAYTRGVTLGTITIEDVDVLRDKQLAGYKVRCDSMNLSGIIPGSVVVTLNPWEEGIEILSGTEVVVERRAILDGRDTGLVEHCVREFVMTAQGPELHPRSTNLALQPWTFDLGYDFQDGDIRIVGLVVEVSTKRPAAFSFTSLKKAASRAATVLLLMTAPFGVAYAGLGADGLVYRVPDVAALNAEDASVDVQSSFQEYEFG